MLDFSVIQPLAPPSPAEPEQPMLFESHEMSAVSAIGRYRKAISALHVVPVKEEHAQSLNNRRLFDACVILAQLEYRKQGADWLERIRNERFSPLFDVRISELAALANIPGKNYQRIYHELRLLQDAPLTWNVVGEDKTVEWRMRAHFLSLLAIGEGAKQGIVRFALDPFVLELVLEPTQWVTLSLRDWGTAASYALYQNTWRYFTTQNKVTAALPVHAWVELLCGKGRYVTYDDKRGPQVTAYGDFKRRVLLPALEAVNRATALTHTLEMKEVKSGRKVLRLQFRFIPKTQQALDLPVPWSAEMMAALTQLGFTHTAITDLGQAYSEAMVAEALRRLGAAEARMKARGELMHNRSAYFKGILGNVAEEQASPEGAKDDPIRKDDAIGEQIRREAAQQAAERRQRQLRDEFDAHQRICFERWFFALPAPEQRDLIDDFLRSDQASPLIRKAFDKPPGADNRSALGYLRAWIGAHRGAMLEQALSNPEDLNFEAWLSWRLLALDAGR